MPTNPTAAAFADLHVALQLDPRERARAQEIHNTVTDALKGRGVIHDAFLQGSFRRKTASAPLRDIDKVVLLANDFRTQPNGHVQAAQLVKAELQLLYPDRRIEIGRHAVTLDLGPGSFQFDIVPAIDLGDDIEIIDLSNAPGKTPWRRSNTRQLIKVVSERNQACDGRFVEYVRVVKHIVRTTMNGVVPGLHVEAFAFSVIDAAFEHDDDAIAAILGAGARLLSPPNEYRDPTGDDVLSARLDPIAREAARTAFAATAEQSAQAVALRCAGDFRAANALWFKIIGDPFTRPSDRDALSRLGSGSGVTAGGVVSSTAAIRPTATRSWRA